MKTLNEVIDSITKQSGLEIRDVRKPEKDRFWVDRETYNDALHYLREYRSDMKHWESDRKGYEDWIEQYKDARNKHQQAVIELKRNDPLTWDELKGMEGKPVWVEYNLHLSDEDARSRMWIIVQKIMPWRQDNELIYYSGFVFGKEEIGKTWNAYRKEMESDTSRSN